MLNFKAKLTSDLISGASYMVRFWLFRFTKANSFIAEILGLGCYGSNKCDIGPSYWGKIEKNGAIAAQLTRFFWKRPAKIYQYRKSLLGMLWYRIYTTISRSRQFSFS